ncbi:DUF5133 domain-containing protein [Streptomyces europaeiscabiei]|uniref:DUF5133 domain-containing protein n=1 Tax=Streptomyces europaeiscabiei TaxID=146819 RepID=UPI0029BF3F40|nr:DUF5133 domain-containing protein [Streptomyces europaeiscabiei]MDX3589318.1 DUF5133 domain-containing protein [Streptomyces europaeiscabiei]
MLLPAKNEVARHLRRYRTWERVMLASPTDRAARDSFEDSGYTLCVLMGKRCAREAVTAAERYLRTSLPAYLQEQTSRPKQEQTGKARKDQSGRPRKGQSDRTRSARRGPPSGRRFTAGR